MQVPVNPSSEDVSASAPARAPATAAVAVPVPGPRPEFESTPRSTPERGISHVYMLAAFVVVIAGIRMASEILQLLLLSIFIAVVGVPVYEWLVQRRIASWLALLIVISGLLLTTLVVFWIVMTSVADFTARQEDYAEKLRLRTRPLQSLIEQWIPETPAALLNPAEQPPSSDAEAAGPNPDENMPSDLNGKSVPLTVRRDLLPDYSDSTVGAAPVDSNLAPGEIDPGDADPNDADPNTVEPGIGNASGLDSTTNDTERSDDQTSIDLLRDPERRELEHTDLFGDDFADRDGWLHPRRIEELPRSRRSWRELIMSQFDPAQIISLGARMAHSVSQILSNTTLILLTVVFILLEASTFPSKLRKAFGPALDTQQRYHQIIVSIRSYLVIKTALSLLTGVLIAGWLWLFGVPYAGLWGMLAFLLNYIPNIGSIIAAVPALMVAWLDLGLLPCLACGIGFIAVNMGIGNFLEPRIMGRGMGLSPLVVFCSMVFWGWALGPVGMLLSVPLTMAVRVALDGFEDTRWLAILLDNPE